MTRRTLLHGLGAACLAFGLGLRAPEPKPLEPERPPWATPPASANTWPEGPAEDEWVPLTYSSGLILGETDDARALGAAFVALP